MPREDRRLKADFSRTPALRVSTNGRFLERVDGAPFFYLGDTAWEMIHRLRREEIDFYLEDRARKGFTALQVVLIPEINGLDLPNAYGDIPLVGEDPRRPNERWFELVDYLVASAARMGIYAALLPTWGWYAVREKHPVFRDPLLFTPETAYDYGVYLGKRYASAPNVIWVLGGDRNPNGYVETWRAMGTGLKKGAAEGKAAPLVTYHPTGPASSADLLHNESWLDFNMVQSGHDRLRRPELLIGAAWEKSPAKPVLNGEPGYEGIPNKIQGGEPKLDAQDVRRFAYQSVFAGACGHTYGANELWMIWSPAIEPVISGATSSFLSAERPWKEALQYPGSAQMIHLRRLIESRPFLERIPAPDLVVDHGAEGIAIPGATRSTNGSYCMVYLPEGGAVRVRTETLTNDRLRAWWYDPRTGAATPAGEHPHGQVLHLTAPTSGADADWVLVLDDASQHFPPPGALRS